MTRVVVIVATCLLAVGVAGWAAVVRYGDEARRASRTAYGHRANLLEPLRAVVARPPAVLWIGDSTLRAGVDFPSYGRTAMETALRDVAVPSQVFTYSGLDPFAYWSLAGRIAAARPLAVVLIANLRLMKPGSGQYTDLVGEIDGVDVPRALALPYAVRGLTAPRILLERTLATPGGEDAFYVVDGLRQLAHAADAWSALGGAELPESVFAVAKLVALQTLYAEYDRPLGPRQPMVRYLAAAVERIARAGIPVLVVVTPVPWEALTQAGRYDAARFAGRIDVLATAVRAAGGELYDLHRALQRAEFRDPGGHFNPDGARKMATLVGTRLRALLAARHPGLVPGSPTASAPAVDRQPVGAGAGRRGEVTGADESTNRIAP